MNVPDNISVIIASDGTAPAPNQIRIVWPLDASTPWAGPLIVGGGALLIVGLGLYLWGLYALRRSRGPRRKGGPKMPKLPKAPKYKPSKSIEATPKGRRSARRAMIAVPVVLVGALGLSGCSGDYWPHFGAADSDGDVDPDHHRAAEVEGRAAPGRDRSRSSSGS